MVTASEPWIRINGSGTGPVVLAVDFDGSGRREATFRDLARLLPGDLDVWHAVPPDDSHVPGLPAQHYVDWWRSRPDAGRPVRAILGYCAGSVYASALADALEAEDGGRPTVVLFNCGVPSVATLDRDFRGIVEGMSVLDDGERDALRQRADRIREDSRDDFDAVSAEYVTIYLDACATAFERFGIPPDVGDELTRLFRSYVNYLTAARSLEIRPQWTTAAALTAREQAGTGFVRHETVFELTRAELLGDKDVAGRSLELLLTPDGGAR